MKLCIAIHGILTGQTMNWTDRFGAHMASHEPGTAVKQVEYRAGPFPLWNCWVKDPRIARALADEVQLYADEADGVDTFGIHFVSHSNGAVIALRTIKLLLARGIQVASATFIGAAITPDIERSGILGMIYGDGAKLGRATAFCSKSDHVLSLPALWPYGRLGKEGFRFGGEPCDLDEVQTVWFDGYGHGDWFEDERRHDTFERVRRWM